jgi:Ca2+-binding RTX toxin-like protein
MPQRLQADHDNPSNPYDDRVADEVTVGMDRIEGGAGDDLLFGDTTVVALSTIEIDAMLAPSVSHQAEREAQLIAEGTLPVDGSPLAFAPRSGAGDSYNDWIDGGDGDDFLIGQSGPDILVRSAAEDDRDKSSNGEDNARRIRQLTLARLRRLAG